MIGDESLRKELDSVTKDQIPIYYINLASAAGRRAEMERQFRALGLVAERVEAVTPNEISDQEKQLYCNPDRYRWLTPVELACSLSHVKVWRRILERQAARAVIFEDDAILSSRLPEFLVAYQSQDAPADLVKIEICPVPIRAEAKPRATMAGIDLRRVFGFSAGGAAYIISARSIPGILERAEIRDGSLDRGLFDSFGRLGRAVSFLQADPGLAVQADQAGLDHGIETSSLKPDMYSRFSTINGASWRRHIHMMRHWAEENVAVGAQKSILDLTGTRKVNIRFLA